MAALYLHNALFANDPQPTPTSLDQHSPSTHLGRASTSSRTTNSHYYQHHPHDRHLSSQSLVLSDNSHPSESVFHGAYSESSGGHERLVARNSGSQSHHAEGLSPGFTSFPSLESVGPSPISARERRRQWELALRKRLRRLRWARRSVLVLIGAWSVYSTVRYFIAFTRFTSHDRHIIVLVLGSVSALCTLLVLISFLLSAFVACLGWKHANLLNYDNLYNMFQSLLGCSTSFLLLGPAIVNLIFVVLWKSSSPDQTDRVSGRCSWDIDALWSGRSLPCDPTKVTPWGFWLLGAVARLFLSAVVAAAYFILSYKYSRTRKPFQRRHHYVLRQSLIENSANTTATSSRSFGLMSSTNNIPVSVQGGRRPSQTTEFGECASNESAGPSSADEHTLRRSRSRIQPTRSRSSDSHTDDRLVSSSHSSPPFSPPPLSPRLARENHTTTLRFADEAGRQSPDSFDNTLSPARPAQAAYSAVPAASPSNIDFPLHQHHSFDPARYPPDEDLTAFAHQFRHLVNQVTRQTQAAMDLESDDNDDMRFRTPSPPTTPRPPALEDRDYFPYLGHIIHRMPTIESLGSRELRSPTLSSTLGDRSVHTLSRPPTRSNTLSMTSDSNPPSRSNSLTASIALTPIEGPSNSGRDESGEMYRSYMTGTPSAMNGQTRCRSRASYYTVISVNTASSAASTPASPVESLGRREPALRESP